ncbi:MAG TPA: hypothetical protein VGG48_14475 [Rhizomicrobium sp.]|jgi:hypothetical protein
MFRLALVVAFAAVLAGCTAPARTSEMVVTPLYANRLAPASPLNHGVTIHDVTGPVSTDKWSDGVDGNAFKGALRLSLEREGMVGADNARFRMDATLMSLTSPPGLGLTVHSVVRYALVDTTTQTTVFDETVSSDYTADLAQSGFSMPIALQAANEGSVQKNIASLITKLSHSELGGAK